MKMTIFAIAAAMGIATAAPAQTDPNGPNVPPGDGISMLGNNPNGQAYTPPGFNRGLNVYPDGQVADRMNYPACSDQVVDRCRQVYTRYTSRR